MPISDGGQPIVHYTVERRRKGSYDWTDKMTTPTNSCKIENLTPNVEYVFRVCAVNSAGMESDPSKASVPFITRESLRE